MMESLDLSPEACERILYLIENPPKPTQALIDLMRGEEVEVVDGREIEYWDCSDDNERLSHTCMHDAIEYHLDCILPPATTEWPEAVEVYGYARMPISDGDKVSWRDRLLEQLYEMVDEEYGDWEKPHDGKIPSDVILAADNLVNTMLSNYTVFNCEKVCTETINVMDWVKEHNPEWLEKGEK